MPAARGAELRPYDGSSQRHGRTGRGACSKLTPGPRKGNPGHAPEQTPYHYGVRSPPGTGASGRADRDLPRPRPLRLWHQNSEDPVLVLRRDLVAVHGAGEHEGTLEAAVAALVAVNPLAALLGLLLLLAPDGEDIVLQGELHILGLHSRQLG